MIKSIKNIEMNFQICNMTFQANSLTFVTVSANSLNQNIVYLITNNCATMNSSVLTKHCVELLEVEILHSPLRLHLMRLCIFFIIERCLRSK